MYIYNGKTEGDRQMSRKKSNSLNYIVNVLHIFVHQNSMNEAKMNENLVTNLFEYYYIYIMELIAILCF